jgi:hypothetical protein
VPAALDNGRRSPKLLRAVVARLLGRSRDSLTPTEVGEERWGQVRDSAFTTDLANCDVLEADGDSAKSLPKTDVEPEFPKRLLLMKRMGQFDDDGPILDHFGLAFVAAQEGGEVGVKPRFAQPQTDH